MAAKKSRAKRGAARKAAKRVRTPMRAAQRRIASCKAKGKAPVRPRWEVHVEFRTKGVPPTDLDAVPEKAAKVKPVGSGFDFRTGTREHYYPAAGHKAAVALALRLIDALVAERRMTHVSVRVVRRLP